MKTLPTPSTLFRSKFLLVALAVFTLVGQASSAVIYRNNFGNSTGGDIAFDTASVGWKVLRAQDGGNVSDQSSATSLSAINNTSGFPDDVANVNAPTSASNVNGIGYLRNATGSRYKGLVYADHYTVDRSNFDIESFDWVGNRASATGDATQRLALQIGSSWYVTAALTPAQGSFNSFATPVNHTEFSIDISSATWYGLTATIGNPFAISGTSTVLPTGNITGFGLFLDPGATANDYSRFDTFTINAIPEPGVFSLIGLAGLALLGRRSKHTA